MTANEPSKSAKGERGAGTLVPPTFCCEYVSEQVAVKAKFHLCVIQAEHNAIAGILATC